MSTMLCNEHYQSLPQVGRVSNRQKVANRLDPAPRRKFNSQLDKDQSYSEAIGLHP